MSDEYPWTFQPEVTPPPPPPGHPVDSKLILLFYFQYSIDDSLPFILNIFLAQAYGVLGTVVITCYGLPWLTILLLPLALIYYYIQNYYRRTSRYYARDREVLLQNELQKPVKTFIVTSEL